MSSFNVNTPRLWERFTKKSPSGNRNAVVSSSTSFATTDLSARLDLTFQLAIGGGTVVSSSDEGKLRSTIEQLEEEIRQSKETVQHLHKLLEEKEKTIHDYKSRLMVSERNHALDLRLETDKHRQLKIELDQRSTLIAQLTNQLHREKQHHQQLQTRTRLGKIILPNKPAKLPTNDGAQQPQEQRQVRPPSIKHVSNRSSSLNNRPAPEPVLHPVLMVKRRPPTPPQQLRPLSSKSMEFDEEQAFTRRHRQHLESPVETVEISRASPSPSRSAIKLQTVLPPIVHRNSPLKALAATPFHREGEA